MMSLSVVDVALELKQVIEINLVKLSYHFINHYFTFSHLKQLYIAKQHDEMI